MGDINIKEISIYKKIKNEEFKKFIDNLIKDITDPLKYKYKGIFSDYTQHDIQHSYRILEHIDELIKSNKKINDSERFITICVSLLHDIGMFPCDKICEKIIKGELSFNNNKFINGTTNESDFDKQKFENYIRKYHAQISAEIIDNLKLFKDEFSVYKNLIKKICQSHNEDINWIESNIEKDSWIKKDKINCWYIACLLRIGDILEIDDRSSPKSLYNYITLSIESKTEWDKHFAINNYKKIFNYGKDTSKEKIKEIRFDGTSDDEKVYRNILNYFDNIEKELIGTNEITKKYNDINYNLIFYPKINNKINPEGFIYDDYKIELDYKNITQILMGEKIYGDKKLGVRELIQNAIDACRLRKIKNSENYTPEINIKINQDTVIIKDNGIGMNNYIIKHHFLNVANSYYQSDEFKNSNQNFNSIGQFGIGFLSSFMLSSIIKIKTRDIKSDKIFLIKMEKGEKFVSISEEKKDLVFFGTEIYLKKVDVGKIFNLDNEINKNDLFRFLQKFFLTLDFKLNIQINDNNKNIENNLVYTLTEKENEEKLYNIKLDEYLNDINAKGYAIVKIKKNNFIEKINDIDPKEEFYYLNDIGDDIIKIENDDTINLDDYFKDGKIRYFKIPILKSEIVDDLYERIKIQKNDEGHSLSPREFMEILEKLEKNHTIPKLNILLHKEYKDEFYDSYFHFYNGEYEEFEEFDNLDIRSYSDKNIINTTFKFEKLSKYGHYTSIPTIMILVEKNIFEGVKNKMYSYIKDEDDYFYSFVSEIFLKGILVKDASFQFNQLLTVIEIKKIKINIESSNFNTEVDRNRFNSTIQQELNIFIIEALLNALIKQNKEYAKFNDEQLDTIKKYLADKPYKNSNYNYDDYFLSLERF